MKLKTIAILFALISILALPNLLLSQQAQQPNSAPVASMTEVVENAPIPKPPTEATNNAPALPPAQNKNVVEQATTQTPNSTNAKIPPPPAETSNIAPLPEVKQPVAEVKQPVLTTPAIPITSVTPPTKDLNPPFTVNPETYYVKANEKEHWQKGFENLVEGFYGVHVGLSTLKIKDTDKPIWFDDAISYINTELQAQINKTFSSDMEQKENHKNIIRKMFTELIPIESIALNKNTYHVLVSQYRMGNNTIEKEWFSVPTSFITDEDIKATPKDTTAEKTKTNFDNAKQHGANPIDTDTELMRHNESSKVWDSKQKKRK